MYTADYSITKMGALYFIPINTPNHNIDLTDFSDEHSAAFGQATIVDISTQDPYRSAGAQDYVVVQIPCFRNGEQLNIDDLIDGELRRTLEYLRDKGLREHDAHPGLDLRLSIEFNINPELT